MVESLFLSAVTALGVPLDARARQAYASLEPRYRGRAYHDLRHIEKTLEAFLAIEEDLGPLDAARATLALIYHDAVYEPGAEENEAQSAAFMRETLGPLGIEETDLVEIERLVLVTRDHVADDPLGAFVADADLSILAAPEGEYDAYATAIRREYAHVPDEAYREGRTAFLRKLLDRRLFASPLMDEEAARANVERELGRLNA